MAIIEREVLDEFDQLFDQYRVSEKVGDKIIKSACWAIVLNPPSNKVVSLESRHSFVPTPSEEEINNFIKAGRPLISKVMSRFKKIKYLVDD